MIVAVRGFDFDTVHKIITSDGDICKYIDDLIPPTYKHCDAIRYNTRYYLYTLAMSSEQFTLYEKGWLNQKLTKDLHVVGYIDEYIPVDILERYINMKKVDNYYKGEKCYGLPK